MGGFAYPRGMQFLAPSLCLAVLVFSASSSAQVSQGGLPLGLQRPLAGDVPTLVLPAPDVATLRAEDAARNHKPLRYGALVPLQADLADGLWNELPDGSRAWRLRVASPGAKSLALEFARFELPEGATLHVYHEDREQILGAYTRANRHDDGGFVFEPYGGDSLVLELDLPPGAASPLLEVAHAIHDYRDVQGLMEGRVRLDDTQQTLGACLVDVNCPQGDPYPTQKRATMRTLSGGALCSGALLNNTANNNIPYVLTADHCGQTASTVFLFRYQTSGCASGSAPTSFSASGCTLLTTSPTYDCRLLRMNALPPASHEPYMAGWTRSTGNATMAFAMGHPSGGPKKISIDNNGTASETTLWRVQWNTGTLEGGSSGGPLFDQNGRVKGPACCVDAFVCTGQTAWFGRFDRFWTSNALAQWLDPVGANPTTLNGWDPYPPCVPPANDCSTSPNSVGPGATMSWSGSTVRSQDNFTIVASGLPPGAANIFFYGPTTSFTVFGNGFRCIGNPITRLPVSNASIFGDSAVPVGLAGSQIDAGETWYFQNWYRNPAGGGAGFNLSDSLRVPFCF